MFKEQKYARPKQRKSFDESFFLFIVKLQLFVLIVCFVAGLVKSGFEQLNPPPEPSGIILEEIKPTNRTQLDLENN